MRSSGKRFCQDGRRIGCGHGNVSLQAQYDLQKILFHGGIVYCQGTGTTRAGNGAMDQGAKEMSTWLKACSSRSACDYSGVEGAQGHLGVLCMWGPQSGLKRGTWRSYLRKLACMRMRVSQPTLFMHKSELSSEPQNSSCNLRL